MGRAMMRGIKNRMRRGWIEGRVQAEKICVTTRTIDIFGPAYSDATREARGRSSLFISLHVSTVRVSSSS